MSTTKTGSHENGNIATGGSTINYTNINYYRDSYAAAATRQDFTQDPNKFTSPVLDALREVAPPLKSPSAEACGYSDRVAQLTVGNSTITTQEAANIIVGYGEWPEYCPDVDATAVDKPTRPDVSVNRFYTLSAKMWQKESKGWYWKFPDILTEKGVLVRTPNFITCIDRVFVSTSSVTLASSIKVHSLLHSCLSMWSLAWVLEINLQQLRILIIRPRNPGLMVLNCNTPTS